LKLLLKQTYNGVHNMDKLSQLRSVLLSHGLAPEEIACYMSLASRGEMSMLDISRSSNIPRTSVYRAVDDLIARGLVSAAKRNRRTLYSAEHPRTLLSEARARWQALEESIPFFEQLLFQRPESISSQVYTGARGFSAAFDAFYDRLQIGRIKHIYSLSHPDLIKQYPKAFERSVKRRESLKIFISLMMPDSIAHSRSQLLMPNPFKEVRYIPPVFNTVTSMLIGGDTVLYTTRDRSESHSVLLTSEPIAGLLRSFFRLVWEKVAVQRRVTK
jgi:sugar-specific transcriptional regulator TrmB